MAGLIGAFVTAEFTYWNRDRELNIRLVEIAIGILRDDPEKSGVSAARRWAIDVIQINSGVNFEQSERDVLLRKPIGYKGYSGDWFDDGWWDEKSGASGKDKR